MLTLPVRISDSEMDLYVILETENLDRMRAYDPAEIVHSALGEKWKDLALRKVVLMFATAADLRTIMPPLENGDPLTALRYLSRGWRYRPESGDHDRNYDSLLNRQ